MSLLSSLCRVALAGAALVAAKPAMAIPAVGVTTGNSLITFDTDSPETLASGPTAITNLTAGDVVVGLDLRPANGVLYALTNNGGVGRLYTINRTTAAATLVSTLSADPADFTDPYTSLSGVEFGTDFNPVVDRLRVVSDANQNLRINVANGLVITDQTLNYASGDTNFGEPPNLTAIGYSNSEPGASTTTLYGLDFNTNSLVIQNPPNNGTLNTVGATGIDDAISISGFDIAPGATIGYATLTSAAYPNASFLYPINLSTGAFLVPAEIEVNSRVRALTLLPAFAPSVTNATTTEGVQTTSGLVITANPSNGSEVTHFKITEISNGILYQNDGTTVINDDSFITVAQGNAGLKFTPDSGFIGAASFKVQASTSNSDAGLSGGMVTATITVTEAPSLVVTTTSDVIDNSDGLTSLREAINFANSNPDASDITFDPAEFSYRRGILLASALPTITTDVTITGPTADATSVAISGDNISNNPPTLTLLTVNGGTVQLSSLILAYGDIALDVQSGNVTVEKSLFVATNTSIRSAGTLAVNNCTITDSDTIGIANTGGTTTVDSCTIIGNGVGIQTGQNVVLRNSLVVGNTTNLATTGTLTDGGHNITVGSGADAGIDYYASLRDNGGPTPTYSLAGYSPAINAGATDLATDQRGVARPVGGADDIGALEFVNNAPTVGSVSPQNTSKKVGDKETFTFTATDTNGATDIREMWLLINRRLNWGEGATLIFVADKNIPTNGLLYLRQGDVFLPPITVGTEASSSAVLDNGAVRIVATDVTVSMANNSNSLTLSVNATLRDGLVGENRLFARAVDSAGAVDLASLAGDMGFVRFGTYTVTPQFGNGTNFAPTLSKLTPTTNNSLLTGGITTAQNFGFFVKDENGIGDMESVIFLAGKQRGWTNTATFYYEVRTRRLYLRSDNGQSWIGGGRVGQTDIIENSQVRVDLSKVKVTIIDNKSFGLTLPLQGKAALGGKNDVWLRVQDRQNLTSPDGDLQGYVLKGTWNLATSNTALASPAPSPSNGSS